MMIPVLHIRLHAFGAVSATDPVTGGRGIVRLLAVALAFSWLAVLSPADGGVVVTAGMSSFVGAVTEEGQALRVSGAGTELTLPKSQVLWFTTESAVDTKLKAARYALGAGVPTPIIRSLLQASMKEESDNFQAASQLHAAIVRAEKAAQEKAETAAPQPRIVQSQRIVGFTLSVQQSALKGWRNWGPSYAPASIQTPIFSSKGVNTTGLVATP
jgi:hypothetical protein